MNRVLAPFVAVFLVFPATLSSQQSFPVVSTVDAPSIAGRPVALDAQHKLLPWPMPDDPGYSYSSHFLSQWTIVWDQFNRQRLPYFYCCFDFDRTTYELSPDPNWVNSTGYLRAMMQGFSIVPPNGKINDPNHIHTVTRVPGNDFGEDWLRRHHQEHHHK